MQRYSGTRWPADALMGRSLVGNLIGVPGFAAWAFEYMPVDEEIARRLCQNWYGHENNGMFANAIISGWIIRRLIRPWMFPAAGGQKWHGHYFDDGLSRWAIPPILSASVPLKFCVFGFQRHAAPGATFSGR